MVVKPRLAIVASHPIQYQAPLFRALSEAADLRVLYAHRQSAPQQAEAGYGVAFDWDIDLFDGYAYEFLDNRARRPNTNSFSGCNTPGIGDVLAAGRFQAAITMGWYLKSYVQTVNACKRLEIPILVRGDSTLRARNRYLIRKLKDALYPPFLRRFDGFLIVGRRARSYLEHFGVTEERMFWSPHAVDNKRFAAGARAAENAREELRQSLGCRPGEHMVLFVGRFVSFKRPLDLVRALALYESIQSLGTSAGVPLTMAGFRNQNELPAIYAAADVLVLPSSGEETWGLVVNEAMACGTPAVVSDAVGCVEDLIDPGETGERYPFGDVGRLAESIRATVAETPGERVKRALERKMSNYSLDMAVEGILRASHRGRKH
jgi:glycosyltransferase involved in cell wall biosynthesis